MCGWFSGDLLIVFVDGCGCFGFGVGLGFGCVRFYTMGFIRVGFGVLLFLGGILGFCLLGGVVII